MISHTTLLLIHPPELGESASVRFPEPGPTRMAITSSKPGHSGTLFHAPKSPPATRKLRIDIDEMFLDPQPSRELEGLSRRSRRTGTGRRRAL